MACKQFFESRTDEIKDGIIHTTYINPNTNRRIKQCSPAYNKLLANCNAVITGKPRIARRVRRINKNISSDPNIPVSLSPIINNSNTPHKQAKVTKATKQAKATKQTNNDKQLTDVYIKQWLQMPLIDPRTKRRIYAYTRSSSEYAILYKIAYDYFLTAGFKSTAIKDMLPREHYLFNDIDVLYYRINHHEFNQQDQDMYKFVDDYLKQHSGDTPNYDNIYFSTEYTIDEHNVMVYITNILVDMIAKYLKYMHMFYNESYERFPLHIDEVREYRNTMHTIKYFMEKKNIPTYKDKLLAYAEIQLKGFKSSHIDYRVIIHTLKSSNNVINALTSWYDELFDIFNYIREPDMSPYADILTKVEDPIERMFDRLTHNDQNAQELYRVLSDVGVLDLLKASKRTAKGSLLNKNRKYITGKCNNSVDPITQEDYKDSEYPLAKLQLMYMLQNKKTKHTHCFYAPEFYNYVVSQITSGKTEIVNPLTKEKLTHKDIKELVAIMQVVYPNIKDPFHYLDTVPFDTKLELEMSDTKHINGITYVSMNIMRKLGDITVRVCKVCTIPKNMDKSQDFIKLIKDLFKNGELLYTYMSPFRINRDMYIRHDDVVCSYQDVEEWIHMPIKLQNKELTDYYNEIRTAFTSA